MSSWGFWNDLPGHEMDVWVIWDGDELLSSCIDAVKSNFPKSVQILFFPMPAQHLNVFHLKALKNGPDVNVFLYIFLCCTPHIPSKVFCLCDPAWGLWAERLFCGNVSGMSKAEPVPCRTGRGCSEASRDSAVGICCRRLCHGPVRNGVGTLVYQGAASPSGLLDFVWLGAAFESADVCYPICQCFRFAWSSDLAKVGLVSHILSTYAPQMLSLGMSGTFPEGM